jgi:hypothetical protein
MLNCLSKDDFCTIGDGSGIEPACVGSVIFSREVYFVTVVGAHTA